MIDPHPITPPPELVKQWYEDGPGGQRELVEYIATQAARWGADQELEACCEWLQDPDLNVDTYKLRAARRPKPLSLAEQALERLAWIDEKLEAPLLNHCNAIHTIRAALERLKELEQSND